VHGTSGVEVCENTDFLCAGAWHPAFWGGVVLGDWEIWCIAAVPFFVWFDKARKVGCFQDCQNHNGEILRRG
jgi:hypothetical protein